MSAEPQPPTGAPSRAPGWWLMLAGVVVIGLGFLLGQFALKGMALVGIGVVGVLMGLGWLYRPWTPEMIAANSGDDFGKLWRLWPLFWKVWFWFSIAVGMAVMFAVLILL